MVLVASDFGKSADVMCTVIVPHFNQLGCMYKIPIIDRAWKKYNSEKSTTDALFQKI